MDAVGTDANKKYEDYLYDAANKKDIDKNQKSYSNTFFFSEPSNKYFDSWASLVGADGYTPIRKSQLLVCGARQMMYFLGKSMVISFFHPIRLYNIH